MGPFGSLLGRACEIESDTQMGLTVFAKGLPADEYAALRILHEERAKFQQEKDQKQAT